MTIAHVVFIAAYEEVPIVAAEIVVDVSKIRVDIVLFVASLSVVRESLVIRADTVGYFRAVVDLGIGADADTVGPGIIIFSCFINNISIFCNLLFSSIFYTVAFALVPISEWSL